MNPLLTVGYIERLKRAAKKARKEHGLSHTEALNIQARNLGYTAWTKLMADVAGEAPSKPR